MRTIIVILLAVIAVGLTTVGVAHAHESSVAPAEAPVLVYEGVKQVTTPTPGVKVSLSWNTPHDHGQGIRGYELLYEIKDNSGIWVSHAKNVLNADDPHSPEQPRVITSHICEPTRLSIRVVAHTVTLYNDYLRGIYSNTITVSEPCPEPIPPPPPPPDPRELHAMITALQSTVSSINSVVTDISDTVTRMNTSITDQNTRLTALESRVNALPTNGTNPAPPPDLSGLESAIENMQGTVSSINSTVTSINSTVIDHGTRIAIIENRTNTPPPPPDLSGLESAIENMQTTLANLITRMTTLENQVNPPPPPPPTGVKGKVYQDTNGNGTLDAGEPGVPNREVIAVSLSDFAVKKMNTDANGGYSFVLEPGGYLVQIIGGGPQGFSYVDITASQMLVLNLIP